MTIAEVKAHEEKVSAQLHEAKALLEQIEAHAKKNKAQAQIEKINQLNAKHQEIEKKWHHQLKTVGAAALAVKVKNGIEADLTKLKSSAEEVATNVNSSAQTK